MARLATRWTFRPAPNPALRWAGALLALAWLTGTVGLGARPAHAAEAAVTCGAPSECYARGRKATTSAERRKFFLAGMRAAEGRLASHADDPEGLFWLAVNTGSEALERGKLQALPAVARMEKLLLRCAEVAPAYEHGGAARVLGRLYQKAPAVISVGSDKNARKWLERALALDGDFPGNLAFAADFLADQGEKARARELARKCLQRLGTGDFGPEADEWRELAREVLGGAS
jgi:hypothetical protein